MGKTIMLSALIQTSLPSDAIVQLRDPPVKSKQLRLNTAFRPVDHQKTQSSKPASATLIVAPTSLLNQWQEELQRSSKPGALKVFVWHGQNRADLETLIQDDEDDDKAIKVVITSYGVLASEHAKTDRSGYLKTPVFEGS